ncbi:hypothetical protein ACQY0O_004762 [Thecaphora frezii]
MGPRRKSSTSGPSTVPRSSTRLGRLAYSQQFERCVPEILAGTPPADAEEAPEGSMQHSPSVLFGSSKASGPEESRLLPSRSEPQYAKRQRALRACERCKKRKQKCDSSTSPCSSCAKANVTCKFPEGDSVLLSSEQREQIRSLEMENEELKRKLSQAADPACGPSIRTFYSVLPSLSHSLLIAEPRPMLPTSKGPWNTHDEMLADYARAAAASDDPSSVILALEGQEGVGRASGPIMALEAAKALRRLSIRALATKGERPGAVDRSLTGTAAATLGVESSGGIKYPEIGTHVTLSIPPSKEQELMRRAFDYLACRTPLMDKRIVLQHGTNREGSDEKTAIKLGCNGGFAARCKPQLSHADNTPENAGFARLLLEDDDNTVEAFCDPRGDFSEYASTETIVINLLLANIARVSGHGPAVWEYSGVAMRTAVANDLHKIEEETRGDCLTQATELDKHLFWSCYCFDRDCSWLWQKPVYPAEEDIETPIPAPTAASNINAIGSDPESLCERLALLNYRIKRLRWRASKLRLDDIQACVALDHDLQSWHHDFETITIEARLVLEDNPPWKLASLLLRMEASSCRIAVITTLPPSDGTLGLRLWPLLLEKADICKQLGNEDVHGLCPDLTGVVQVFEAYMGLIIWQRFADTSGTWSKEVDVRVSAGLQLLSDWGDPFPASWGLVWLLQRFFISWRNREQAREKLANYHQRQRSRTVPTFHGAYVVTFGNAAAGCVASDPTSAASSLSAPSALGRGAAPAGEQPYSPQARQEIPLALREPRMAPQCAETLPIMTAASSPGPTEHRFHEYFQAHRGFAGAAAECANLLSGRTLWPELPTDGSTPQLAAEFVSTNHPVANWSPEAVSTGVTSGPGMPGPHHFQFQERACISSMPAAPPSSDGPAPSYAVEDRDAYRAFERENRMLGPEERAFDDAMVPGFPLVTAPLRTIDSPPALADPNIYGASLLPNDKCP